MNKKMINYILGAAAALPGGLYSAGYLHCLLSQQPLIWRLRELLGLVQTSSQFRWLTILLILLWTLAICLFALDDKPYISTLKNMAQGIDIPVSSGQFQHGSAQIMTNEEIDKTFASVIIPKTKKGNSNYEKAEVSSVGQQKTAGPEKVKNQK